VKKRYQVFVSSTYEDLKEEREKAMLAVSRVELCFPVGMEKFPATSCTQWELIKEVIDESDIYILIIGERYGKLTSDTKTSWTQREYEYAKEKGKPILSFLTKKNTENEHLEKFRKTVENDNKMVDYWRTPDELARVISESLTLLIKKRPPKECWVKHDLEEAVKTLTTRRDATPFRNVIKRASQDIYVTGVKLYSCVSEKDSFKELLAMKRQLKINLLAFDTSNSEFINAYNAMRGDYKEKVTLDHLVELLEIERLEIRVINSIPPVMFLARDIHTPNGYISAEHFFNNSDSMCWPCVELYADDGKWYEIYMKQLETIWKRGVLWNPIK